MSLAKMSERAGQNEADAGLDTGGMCRAVLVGGAHRIRDRYSSLL